MKHFRYVDLIRTKKGKLRTWVGHERVVNKDNKLRRYFRTEKINDNKEDINDCTSR